MPAQLWQPPPGPGPGWCWSTRSSAISHYIQDRGRDLAALGYVVCAPEIYWRLDDHEIDEADPDVLAPGDRAVPSGSTGTPRCSDLQDTLSHLRGMIEVEGGVGLIGFCFGGGLAFNVAAVDDVDVLVSYYGSAHP